jgi:hypothetical protein
MSRHVTCTVVSVMPYMLTSRVRASAWRAIHGASVPGSSASPPKITTRSACALRGRRVGGDQLPERARRLVQHRDALAAQQRMEVRRRARDERGHDDEPPAMQQRAQSSQTEKSNAIEWNSVQTSLASKPKPAWRDREQPRDLRVFHHHALGPPVEPEV